MILCERFHILSFVQEETYMGAARILFADDDSALREVVGNQLVGQGYVVQEADDGERRWKC